jgi:hypothetical protein
MNHQTPLLTGGVLDGRQGDKAEQRLCFVSSSES